MAQKTKGKGFSRFLDFIGLVDADADDREDVFDEPKNTARSSRTDARSARSDTRRAVETDSARGYDSPRGGERNDYRSETDRRLAARPARDTSRARSSGEDEYWRGAWSSRDTARDAEREPVRESLRERVRESVREPVRESAREADEYAASRHQTVIFHLRRFEDCRDVILALLEHKSVLLNLDPLDESNAQRVIDAMGGAAFALGALISKASDKNYLITPNNVVVANGNVEPRGQRERML